MGWLLDVPAAIVAYKFLVATHSRGLLGRRVVGDFKAAPREFEVAALDFLRACELVMDQAVERTDGVVYFPEASTDSWNVWYENLDAALEDLRAHHRALERGIPTASMRRRLRARMRKLGLPVFKIATSDALDAF